MATRVKDKEGNIRTENTSRQKITKGINQVTTTQTQMARALKISQQRVSQMAKDGTLPVDETGALLLVDGLRKYYQGTVSGAAGLEEIDLEKERALHEKVKREIAELKLDKMKKNAYSARVVEYVMTAGHGSEPSDAASGTAVEARPHAGGEIQRGDLYSHDEGNRGKAVRTGGIFPGSLRRGSGRGGLR